MDTTIRSYPVTKKSIKNAFDPILMIKLDDNVLMTIIV